MHSIRAAHRVITLLTFATLLSGCGAITTWHNTNDFNTTREYGVVLSQREGHKLSSDISEGFSSLFGSSSTPQQEDPITKIEYVIQKDNGQKVTIDEVPDNNDPVFFPGQRVMILTNDGYTRVLPPDPEYNKN